MNKRDKLIEKYASDLKDKCNVKPDMDLLRKVTIGCGPSIYNSDSSTVSATEKSELTTLRNKFLIKKLGLSENDKLDLGIEKVMQQYICNSNMVRHEDVEKAKQEIEEMREKT